MPHFENLDLYYRASCPYCVKVKRFMDANDITLNLKDTTQSEHAAKLVEVGGMSQVPCLFIDGDPLYESNDIIDFLASQIAED